MKVLTCIALFFMSLIGPASLCAQSPSVPGDNQRYEEIIRTFQSMHDAGTYEGHSQTDRQSLLQQYSIFSRHQSDPGLLVTMPQNLSSGDVDSRLPAKHFAAIRDLLLTVNNVDIRHAQKTAFEILSAGETWSILTVLENKALFAFAGGWAQAMEQRDEFADSQDILSLIATRDMWLAGQAPPPNIQESAAQSKSTEVKENLALWNNAVTHPATYEELDLAYRIWKTVHFDCDSRAQSAQMSRSMSFYARRLFDNIKASGEKGTTISLALLNTGVILADGAFDNYRMDQLDQIKKDIDALDFPETEQTWVPAYYHAKMQFTLGKLKDAESEYSTIFFNGCDSDVCASAGLELQRVYAADDNAVAGMAILATLPDLYPQRANVLSFADAVNLKLKSSTTAPSSDDVAQYKSAHFDSLIQEQLLRRNAAAAASK